MGSSASVRKEDDVRVERQGSFQRGEAVGAAFGCDTAHEIGRQLLVAIRAERDSPTAARDVERLQTVIKEDDVELVDAGQGAQATDELPFGSGSGGPSMLAERSKT